MVKLMRYDIICTREVIDYSHNWLTTFSQLQHTNGNVIGNVISNMYVIDTHIEEHRRLNTYLPNGIIHIHA